MRIPGILAHSQSGAADHSERCFRRSTSAQDQGKPEALSGWKEEYGVQLRTVHHRTSENAPTRHLRE
jgi:hypothetical protein